MTIPTLELNSGREDITQWVNGVVITHNYHVVPKLGWDIRGGLTQESSVRLTPSWFTASGRRPDIELKFSKTHL